MYYKPRVFGCSALASEIWEKDLEIGGNVEKLQEAVNWFIGQSGLIADSWSNRDVFWYFIDTIFVNYFFVEKLLCWCKLLWLYFHKVPVAFIFKTFVGKFKTFIYCNFYFWELLFSRTETNYPIINSISCIHTG